MSAVAATRKITWESKEKWCTDAARFSGRRA
jgi:hypothetical protein